MEARETQSDAFTPLRRQRQLSLPSWLDPSTERSTYLLVRLSTYLPRCLDVTCLDLLDLGCVILGVGHLQLL
jgi:hypothetical protein